MDDITSILSEWPYDPSHTVRMIFADDGRNVLQVRLPLGVEQYELEGRPDGSCPFETETVLDEIEERLKNHIVSAGTDAGFEINHEDFLLLQGEGVLFYYRYLLLFQLNDHARVIRDTMHNLRICELVERHVRLDEDKVSLLQYKPYMIRVNSTSRAMLKLQEGDKDGAEALIQEAIEAIRSLPEMESPNFQFERIRSVNFLRSALKQVTEQKVEVVDQLKTELQKALAEENYERAAELRDKIKEII
jgi:hypothetical protein